MTDYVETKVRLPREVHETIKKKAKKEFRSVNKQMTVQLIEANKEKDGDGVSGDS